MNTKRVKISAKCARLRFHGCEPDYIRDVCHASCCRTSTRPNGTLITIHPSEREFFASMGHPVVDGLLVPRAGEKHCPFENDGTHLCRLHGTGAKPFGCVASPFTLNRGGTLVVRNRYKLLRCYDVGPRLPAYVAFRSSLDRIFGDAEARRICEHLNRGGGDLFADMPAASFAMLTENDAAKKGLVTPTVRGRPADLWGNK